MIGHRKWNNTAEITGKIIHFKKKGEEIIFGNWENESKKLESFQKLLEETNHRPQYN